MHDQCTSGDIGGGASPKGNALQVHIDIRAALGIGLVQGFPSADVKFWVGMLLVQSLPYLAALIMALLSSMPPAKNDTEASPA